MNWWKYMLVGLGALTLGGGATATYYYVSRKKEEENQITLKNPNSGETIGKIDKEALQEATPVQPQQPLAPITPKPATPLVVGNATPIGATTPQVQYLPPIQNVGQIGWTPQTQQNPVQQSQSNPQYSLQQGWNNVQDINWGNVLEGMGAQLLQGAVQSAIPSVQQGIQQLGTNAGQAVGGAFSGAGNLLSTGLSYLNPSNWF